MKNKFFILIIVIVLLIFTGCSKSYENDDVVKVGYVGNFTEVPLFAAYENGYFEKEGVKVELVKINDNEVEQKIKNGNIDAFTCDYKFLKWNERNINVKVSMGITSGAIEIITSKDSHLQKISDIENKKIGIANQGDGTMVAAINVLSKNNIKEDSIKWVYLKDENPTTAIENGEVDAAVVWDINKEYNNINVIYKTGLIDNENSAGNNHSSHGNNYFYINFAGVRSEISDKYPEKTAGILRAWIEGAATVEEDKDKYLSNALEKGYIKNVSDDDEAKIEYFMWMPSVKTGKENLKEYIHIQKSMGIINSNLNEDNFLKSIFADVLPFWD
ncbi:PhnD/SsuA/transferrin family substrate-binding protein [Clostridium chromiireducens]|uniref:PhnD/SsuA/transferrin family substrate-binding protein n=1 Tax=Clostridium chromiireducens TaxID=225345 RepID=A0A964RRC3_9CLOT|nr:ABC transporter substrate-binding protein [Clostridium chromiireducens]MVX66416.1 PhnD/SsuA/transferrin family substrate-binding protein [Clostridium chromiireducens]